MAKRKTPVVKNKTVMPIQATTEQVKALSNSRTEVKEIMLNGLSEAIMGFNPGSIGTQLDQVDTLFLNNRWYMISNLRQLLSELYVEHGLVQTVVDVPVDDGMRGGIKIQSEMLSEEELKDLAQWVEHEDILSSVAGRAMKWNRLFGGAGILIMTDQDYETPLDIEAIGPDSPLEFRAIDMWELFWDKQNAEGFDAELQEQQYEFYNYYAKKVHKSRVLKLKGLTAPSFIRPRLRGWGFSIIESLVRSINQYLKSNDLCFQVLDEFKVDVYKIKNFSNTLLSSQGTAAIQKRLQLANQQKNFQHALTMDAEDDFLQKELSFSGLAETMQQIRMQIASDLRMPLTKIFGISASGFNSGEDDIENYNSMVESTIRSKIKFHLIKVLELQCQKMFGSIPDDLTIDFEPLRVLSAEQEENVKTQKFNRALAAITANLIDQKDFRDICNKGKLFEVQLDTSEEALPDLPMPGEEINEPGANKDESAKMKPTAPKAGGSVTKAKDAAEVKNKLSDIALYKGLPNEVEKFGKLTGTECDKLRNVAGTVLANPGKVDEELWTKAKRAAEKAQASDRWAFTTWWYKEHGGKFS